MNLGERMTESSDLVWLIDVLEAALNVSGDFESREEEAIKVAAAFCRLSDANWNSLHEFLSSWEGRMEDLDGADWAAGIVIMAAKTIDPRQTLDTKARALGLASSMPFPPFRGGNTLPLWYSFSQ